MLDVGLVAWRASARLPGVFAVREHDSPCTHVLAPGEVHVARKPTRLRFCCCSALTSTL